MKQKNNFLKKLSAFTFALILTTTSAQAQSFTGSGTQADPFLIATAAQLAEMRDLVNTNTGNFRSAHYRITQSIDMQDATNAADRENWVPISVSGMSFTGVFDGNGHTISNLTITSGNRRGLFGDINYSNAVVRNVALENVNINTTGDYVGGIVGLLNRGRIENCYVSGSITGVNVVGGIAGAVWETTVIVERNYSTAVVSGRGAVGGIVGSNGGGTIRHNVALNPSITATGGNIAGRVAGESFVNGTLTNNHAWYGMLVNGAIPTTNTGADQRNGASVFAYRIYDHAFWADKGWTEHAVNRNFATISHLRTYEITVEANPATGAATLTHYPTKAAIRETVTLSQTAAMGYDFSGWWSQPDLTISHNSFTMPTPAEVVSVTANYAPYPLVITGGEGFTYTGGVLTITQNGTYTIANRDPLTPTNHRIVVAAGVTATVTLNGVNIAGLGNNQSAFLLDNGANVTLMLADGSVNTLRGGEHAAGIQTTLGSLTIDGTGTLIANGGNRSTGIGGGIGGGGGNISISGGNITATGGNESAGIGGGRGGAGGNITILGGNITATSGNFGAGIGGGNGSAGGTISISGGTITANGGMGGAGIGGGYLGGGGNILIYGENTIVTATGRDGAEHIGAGVAWNNIGTNNIFVLIPQENLKTNNPSAGTQLGNPVQFSATPNADGKTIMLELPEAFTAMGLSPLSVVANPTAAGRFMSAIVSEALNASDFEFSLEGYANSPIIKRGSALRETGAKVDFVNLTAINWSATAANGANATASTTEITLTFDVEPVGLTVNHITVNYATKGALTGSGLTRTLAISNISADNGGEITVSIVNFGLFSFVPGSQNVVVYRDITPPTAQVQFRTNGFEPFVSSPDFKRFFRNSVIISISANDESGIAEVSWVSVPAYLGEANAANLASVSSWTESTVFTVFANKKFYLYVRVTDNHGNIAYFGTEGIVVFTDAQATASANRAIFSGDKNVPITFNGNTVASVMNGATALSLGDYTVYPSSIEFSGAYLDGLGVGTHTLTVRYGPLGEPFVNTAGNDTPGTTVINLTINKAQGADVSTPTLLSKTYNSITVNEVTNAGTSGQTVEFGISTNPAVSPAIWQNGTTFTGLESNATYYVFARTAESATHFAGTPQISAGITTDPKTWTATVSPNQHDFPSAVFGYGTQAAQEFTITNTGNQTLTGINIGFDKGDEFEISSPLSPTTIPAGETATFSVRPKTGLNASTVFPFTDNVGIDWANGDGLLIPLSFKVNKAPGAPVSAAPTVSGTPTYNSITVYAVSNPSGNGQTVEYAISTNPNELPGNLIWQDGTTFSGLSADTDYYVFARTAETANFHAGAHQVSSAIRTLPKTWMATVEPISGDFGTAVFGYCSYWQHVFVIENTGNQTLENLTAKLNNAYGFFFEIVTGLNTNILEPGEKAAVYVRPKARMNAGIYTDKLTISWDNGGSGIDIPLSFTVNPATLTVTPNAGQWKYFGETDPILTFTTGKAVDTDVPAFSGNLSRVIGETVGNYAITQGTLALTGIYATNYTLNFTPNVVFEIRQRPIQSASIHVVAPLKGQTPNTVATPIDHHNAYTASAVSWSPTDNPFLASTQYTATVTLTADENHTFIGMDLATINGQKATILSNIGTAVTISYQFPATQEKEITALTVESQPSNLQYTHGDALNLSGLVVRIAYSDLTFDIVPFSMLSSYGVSTIPAHGDRLTHVANHGKPVVIEAGEISINTPNLTVLQMPVSITGLSANNKMYSGTTDAQIVGNAIISGKLPEDEVSVVYGTANFVNANAGTGKEVTFAGFGLTGVDAGNYDLMAQPAAVFADITPAPLSISGFHISKVFDGTDAVVGSLGNLVLNGFVNNETAVVDASNVLAFYATSDAGTGIAIHFVGHFELGAGTANPNNYMITQPSGITGEITRKPVDVIWTNTNLIFDGTAQKPSAHIIDVFGGTIDLVVSSEQTNVGTYPATASFVPANANYVLINPTTNFTISAKAVDVVWTNTNLVFDGNAQKPTAHIVDVFGGTIDLAISGEQTNVGTYQATASFVPANANYILNNPTTNFTISPKEITISGFNISKNYDGNTNVIGGFGNLQFVGLVNNETANVDASAVTAVYASPNIGTNIAIIFSGNFAMTGGTADPNNYTIVQPTDITGEIIAHSSTNIYGLSIPGHTVLRDGKNFSVEISACGINLLDIFIDTASGSVAKIDGAITSSIQLNYLGNNHFEIVVTAPNGDKETYTLTVNKPVAFEQVALVRWGNTLTVINNPDENGGFVFTSFRWFKNGVEVHDGQSYTICLAGEQINPEDVWRVELTAENISGVLRTCEASIRFAVTQRVIAYPNPVSAGATLWIETNATDSQLEGAVIDVYNLSGQLLDTIEVHSRTTAISINRYGTGTYIFVFRGRDGFRQELKIMVNR